MAKKKRKDSLNLYRFIRLILGEDISDRQIAIRWKMDEKNFHEFKIGNYPVPRLSKLEELASVLGINKHLIFQVASGTNARKVFNLIKKVDLPGQIKLLSKQLNEAHKTLAESEKRCKSLFEHANDAIFVADAKTGKLINCNNQAEKLTGRSRDEIIGKNRSILHPLRKKSYYTNHFKKHIRIGKINERKKTEVVKKDGSIVSVHISAKVMELDGRKVIQGIFREIGKKK